AKAFEQDFSAKIFRYIDLEDVVPHLPSVSLVANAYTHCLNEVGLATTKLAAASGLDALKQAAGTSGDGVVDAAMADQLWDVVKGRIASHMIGSYQARVEAKCKEHA